MCCCVLLCVVVCCVVAVLLLCCCCVVVAAFVAVIVVVVSDADESVCTFTAPQTCMQLQANWKRANLETWACTKPRE